jgi:hypothetical protein
MFLTLEKVLFFVLVAILCCDENYGCSQLRMCGMLVLSVYERCVKPLQMACTAEFIRTLPACDVRSKMAPALTGF